MKEKDLKSITITGVPRPLINDIENLKDKSGLTMSSYLKTILRNHVDKSKSQ